MISRTSLKALVSVTGGLHEGGDMKVFEDGFELFETASGQCVIKDKAICCSRRTRHIKATTSGTAGTICGSCLEAICWGVIVGVDGKWGDVFPLCHQSDSRKYQRFQRCTYEHQRQLKSHDEVQELYEDNRFKASGLEAEVVRENISRIACDVLFVDTGKRNVEQSFGSLERHRRDGDGMDTPRGNLSRLSEVERSNASHPRSSKNIYRHDHARATRSPGKMDVEPAGKNNQSRTGPDGAAHKFSNEVLICPRSIRLSHPSQVLEKCATHWGRHRCALAPFLSFWKTTTESAWERVCVLENRALFARPGNADVLHCAGMLVPP